MIDLRKIIMQAMPASFFHLCLCVGVMGVVWGAQLITSYALHADSRLSVSENIRRIDLIKRVAKEPQSLEVMVQNDIDILFQDPSIIRHEENTVAYYFHGESCALDIYFSTSQKHPAYVEFRTLSMNEDIQQRYDQADEKTLRSQCLKDVMDAQGVGLPSSVAEKPLPSWDSPYRS